MRPRAHSEERRELIQDLFVNKKQSLGEIAERLNVSRNVVSGLIRRMELIGKGKEVGYGGWKKRRQVLVPYVGKARR